MQLKLNIFPKLIILIISIFNFSNVMAYEEPQYTVIKENNIYEIRYYSDRLAVQTTNGYNDRGFRKLFNYISGSNKKSTKVKMTTPVTESEKIAMTVPVTEVEENTQMVMQFYLPSNFTIDTAPIPTNPAVELVNIKGGYFAVITYSGRLTDSNFNKHKDLLKEKLTEDGIEIVGKEIKATYNSPYTLPVFRRNEVMMRIIFDEKT